MIKIRFKYLLYLCMLFILAAMVKSYTAEPLKSNIQSGTPFTLNNLLVWDTAERDGKQVETCSYQFEYPSEGLLVISLKTTSLSFSVYLEEEQIYDFQDPMRERGTVWHFIELPTYEAGQTLRFQASPDSGRLSPIADNPVYLGYASTVFLCFLKDTIYAAIFACFCLLLCMIIFSCQLFLHKKNPDNPLKELNYLGFFILAAGLWVLLDSQLLQLVIPYSGLLWFMSFIAFFVMPIPLLYFMENILQKKLRRWELLCRLFLVLILAACLTFLFKPFPLSYVLTLTHLLILISAVLVLKECITEYRLYKRPEIKVLLTGFALLFVFAVAALAAFYMDKASPYSLFYCIGIFLFIVYLFQAAFYRLDYYLKSNAETSAYQKLAYLDAMTGLYNRTAFMEAQTRDNSSRHLAYIICDINNLKPVNDYHGHIEGDQLIKDAAVCLQRAFRNMGFCFRIGGDEFAVILPNCTSSSLKAGLVRLEEEIKSINLHRSFPVSLALGYSLRTDLTKNIRAMYEEADANMYLHKQQIKNEISNKKP